MRETVDIFSYFITTFVNSVCLNENEMRNSWILNRFMELIFRLFTNLYIKAIKWGIIYFKTQACNINNIKEIRVFFIFWKTYL